MAFPWIIRSFDCDSRRATLTAALLTRTVAAAALALIAATWPLWTPQAVFPRVPLAGICRSLPAWLDWTALGAVGLALALALIFDRQRRVGRWSLVVFSGAIACLVLADQHRLQPWAYQFAVLALVLAALPAAQLIAWARLLTASVYFYSALSKLDRSFIESGGGQIVEGLLTFLHVAPERVSMAQRELLAGALGVGELLIALGLCWRRSRPIAWPASLMMHTGLLASLGPWGVGSKPGVLLWNAYFIAQNVILFGVAGERQPETVEAAPDQSRRSSMVALVGRTAIRLFVAFVVVFPATEPFELCDVWPAWAVYATGPERLRVYVDEAAADRLAAAVRPYVDRPRFEDGRCLVRIDRWSLDATNAPLYPQNRFRLGVALALAEATSLNEQLHVEIEGPADRWSGSRASQRLAGRTAVERVLQHDWFNGLPRTSRH